MFSFFGGRSKKSRKTTGKFAKRSFTFERLENREVLTTFSVANLNDSGAGSLRQAIIDSNAAVGADVINFNIAGTIGLKSALPTITGAVNIDGTTAPGFAGTPVVQVDFNNKGGLLFSTGSDHSALRALSIVDASKMGVKLDGAGTITIVGNYIGLGLDGSTIIANRSHGLELISSNNNIIGDVGDNAENRNVISGNGKDGIRLDLSSFNAIAGNYIGTDATGTLDKGNKWEGILVTDSSEHNVIGLANANVISGNDYNGVYIKDANANKVANNIIGLNAAANAALGNNLDGLRIENSDNNAVGDVDPYQDTTYYNANDIGVGVQGWQGLRAGADADEYLITGTSGDSGILYDGNIQANSGTAYTFQYPVSDVDDTTAYGPNLLDNGDVQIVGTYTTTDESDPVLVNSFLYQGEASEDGFADDSNYRTINYPGSVYTYLHSTAGGLAVGNYDSPTDHGSYDLPYGPGHGFIYDIEGEEFLADIHYPGSISNSAYGIWYNGGTSYTIVGGYSTAPVDTFQNQEQPIDLAYMVDYDSETGEFSHWTSYEYPYAADVVTHFEGVSSAEKGVYTLNAQTADAATGDPIGGSWVTVHRLPDGSFSTADAWLDLNYADPNTGEPVGGITTSDSVYGNKVVGINIADDTITSYQATINVQFTLSNVISGNKGNGISLYGADNNTIAMNYVGTDLTGAVDLGNGSNGILITSSSANNMIGGELTGGNNPTEGTFVVPPMGNLISGNNANGVLISSKATNNQLSGNFIGTDALGNAAIGNTQDGVQISGANGNSLIGCLAEQNPFVFYNVVSGNGGNGLRVNNSNNTVIQANFFGLGADNDTAVGNALNGVLVEGTSNNTTLGGRIPLGNVMSANGQNGVAVQGKASNLISFNTFAGIAAFTENTTLGNGQDGILINSTGSGILVRTSVISENLDDGIEVSGKAKGVQIVDTIIGLNSDGTSGMGNADNGIEIGGSASSITVGGLLDDDLGSVAPHNAISDNGGYGVAVLTSGKKNVINRSFIGTDIFGLVALGNANSGVYLGSGTSETTIGSTQQVLKTLISGNGSDGIVMEGTTGNTVIGTLIGTDVNGEDAISNGGYGLYITSSSKNVIGGTATGQGNTIAFNSVDGVFVVSGTKNGILQNSIFNNGISGITLGEGANNNQAAPVLTSTSVSSDVLTLTGSITSKKNTTYSIEIFASEEDNASGRYYLGKVSVKTNSSGVGTFQFVGDVPSGANYITATATDPDNNTSQFSAAVNDH